MNPFVHPALFYRGAQEYLAGTVPFIREGLADDQPVAVAVPGPNLELLRAELGSEAAGVRLLDMTYAGRNPGRIIPGVLRAFADTHPTGRVRIIGEPIWAGRSQAEYPACVQHEALINMAFRGREVSILCPYDLERLDPVVLADAEATHPVLIDRNGQRTSGDYAPEHIVATYNQPLPLPPPDAVKLAFDATNLRDVRHFAAKHACRAGLTEERLEELELAVAEVVTNSVIHGGGYGIFTVWIEAGQLVCQVDDNGRITNPLAGRIPPASDQPGGRGLLLVNHFADLVRIYTSDSGTAVRLYFTPE